MKELLLSPVMVRQIAGLYAEMEAAYDQVAKSLSFSCDGCPDNCCDSYFIHHTYLEWCYLWRGIRKLDPDVGKKIIERAVSYQREVERALRLGQRPQCMCPLNENGLCMVYEHRLLVCRTHGVPATMTRPDGEKLSFPGCFRCQEIVDVDPAAVFERTPMLRRMALLENELLENRRHLVPRVRLTIAEMLVKGPPVLPDPLCSSSHCGK